MASTRPRRRAATAVATALVVLLALVWLRSADAGAPVVPTGLPVAPLPAVSVPDAPSSPGPFEPSAPVAARRHDRGTRSRVRRAAAGRVVHRPAKRRADAAPPAIRSNPAPVRPAAPVQQAPEFALG